MASASLTMASFIVPTMKAMSGPAASTASDTMFSEAISSMMAPWEEPAGAVSSESSPLP